jgi:hypothetical protein
MLLLKRVWLKKSGSSCFHYLQSAMQTSFITYILFFAWIFSITVHAQEIQWQETKNEIPFARQFTPDRLATVGNTLFVGRQGAGLCYTSDKGANWTFVNGDFGYSVHSLLSQDSTLWVSTSNGLFRLQGHDTLWAVERIGFKDSLVGNFVLQNSTLYVSTNGSVYRSVDKGQTWKNILANSFLDRFVGGFRILDTNFFAGTRSGTFRSINNGATWVNVIGINHIGVTDILSCRGQLFASTNGGGIFRSSDGGFSWQSANRGLPTQEIRALAVIGHSLFAATDSGAFYSNNLAEVWMPINTGLSQKNLFGMVANGSTLYTSEIQGKIFIAGIPSSITSVSLTQSSISALSSKHSITIYPNPTSDFITVEATPECASTPLRITLRNALGAAVLTLEAQSADGLLRKELNVAQLASGAYSVELSCGAERLVGRFVRF